jgi:hypothetical protein
MLLTLWNNLENVEIRQLSLFNVFENVLSPKSSEHHFRRLGGSSTMGRLSHSETAVEKNTHSAHLTTRFDPDEGRES